MQLRENIVWMYKATKGSRVRIALYIMLGLLSVAASLLLVWLTKSLVDQATHSAEESTINLYIGLLVGTILLQQLLQVLRIRVSNYTATTMMNRQRFELFDTVMRSEWSGKELRHTGDMVNRIESDSRTLSEALCITLPSIFVTLIQFFAAFRFLQLLDTRLSWIIVAIMPISLILSRRYIFTIRELTSKIRSTDSSLQSHIQEQIQNRTIINTIGDSTASNQTLQGWNSTLLEQTMRRVNYSLYSRTLVQVGFGIGYVVALTWGIYGLRSGAVTFGMLTAFLQLVTQIQRPSVELATQLSNGAKSIASGERLQEIYAMRHEEQGPKIILGGRVGIRATDVNFEYADGAGRQILSSFSYDFAPNELHAIVGHTGVGKSTLVRIMLGMLKPNSGSVELYSDQGISAPCSPSTRPNFIYVPQGNTLMSGTIRQNLLLANPTASEQQIAEALRIAVAEFVFELPLALDTLCGERGSGLSEGEAQRIAIARGILQCGNILLLDEPTSALDSATEELLISRLREYAKNKTLIMVTHRDTAAKLCTSTVKMS